MTDERRELHLAVAGPMDVQRLAAELDLLSINGAEVPVGRGGHSITELVLALAPLVDRLDLITLDTGLEQPVNLHGAHIRLAVGRYRPRGRTRGKDLFAVERAFVAATIATWQPDVVSAHWTYEYALGALDGGRPSLITVRDWAPTILRHSRDRYRAMRLLMQLLAFARGQHFAAASPYMARKVERITRRPCLVLPNALGSRWFAADHHAVSRGDRVLAVNNGFGRRKNVQRLLEAWPMVLEQVPHAELLLAGTGYELDGPAHVWARKRKLLDGVSFLGPVPRSDLPALLRSVNVFAHPALEESFGMVVLEAMASGLPVVGGDRSGAVPWLLADGAGMLVDVRHPAPLATGLIQLLCEPELADATGQRGKKRAQHRFSTTAVAEAYVERLTALARDTA